MDIVQLVLRWLHILSAIALMGGAIFVRMALLPSVRQLSADLRPQLQALVRSRWARVVAITTALLLITGIINMILIPRQNEVPRWYNPVIGIKFLLALPVFFIASALSGRSKMAERMRERESMWLNINLVLATLIVVIAGVLRFTH